MITGEPFEIRTGRKGSTGAGNLYTPDPAAVARLKKLEAELAAQRKARAKARAAAVVQQYKRPRPVVDEVTDDVCVQTPDEGEAQEESTMPKKKARRPRWKPTDEELDELYNRLQADETLTAVAEDTPVSPQTLSERLKRAGYDMAFVTNRRLAPPPAPPKPSSNGHVSIPTPEPVPEPEPTTTAVAVAGPAAALQPAGDVAGQLDAVRELLSLAQAGRVQVSGKMQIVLNVEIDLS